MSVGATPPPPAARTKHMFKLLAITFGEPDQEPVCTCGNPWPCMKAFRHYIVTSGQTARCGVTLASDLPSTTHFSEVTCPVCLGTVIPS